MAAKVSDEGLNESSTATGYFSGSVENDVCVSVENGVGGFGEKTYYTPTIIYNEGSTDMEENPDYCAKQIVTPTDHKRIYKKGRANSLCISMERALSYPLSDDNIKGKALDSGRHDSVVVKKQTPHGSKVSQHIPQQLSMASQLQDVLQTTYKPPNHEVQLQKFLRVAQENEHWSENVGFRRVGKAVDSTILHFYKLVNVAIRCGGKISLCLLCCQPIAEDIMETPKSRVKSHIFSNCLLESYSKIHDCEPGFIFDPSSSTSHSPQTFTLPLLCSECDHGSCLEERWLRNLYLHLMDPQFSDKNIKVNKPAWLWYILATLLFRGMLLINFFELFNSDVFDSFQEKFLKIRHYLLCLRNAVERKKLSTENIYTADIPECLINDFGLFLLPLGSLHRSTPGVFGSIFDFALRNPQQTYLVQDPNNAFLCTNFDCFYFILRLSDCKSISLENSCLNVLEDNKIVCGINKPHIFLPSSSNRFIQFPHYLLQYKFRQTEQLQNICLKNHTLNENTMAITERIPRSHSLPDFSRQLCLENIDIDLDLLTTDFCEEASKFEMWERAKKVSPLKDIKKLMKEKAALEEKIKYEHTDPSTLVLTIKKLEQKNKQLEKQLQTKCSKHNKASQKVQELLEENKKLKQEKEELSAKLLLEQGPSESDPETLATPVSPTGTLGFFCQQH